MTIRKIAIFVEGQAELIFIRNILNHLFDGMPFSTQCFKLHSNDMHEVPYKTNNPSSVVHVKIINVQNDAKVISAINERERGLFSQGYHKIIGLRDTYSREYKKLSPGVINEEVTNKFIHSAHEVIERMSEPDKISMHFSIMELESWWISMYCLFEKIHEDLTESNIQEKLGYNLSDIDVEQKFFHPASELSKILGLSGIPYNKKLDEVESITNRIDLLDIWAAVENNRCLAFKDFCNDILQAAGASCCLE